MVTNDEIEHRVEHNDVDRTARRAVVAKHIHDLAQRHPDIAAQLGEIEQELRVALTDAQGLITLDELAFFTDIPAPELTRWATGPAAPSAHRKRPGPRARGAKPTTRRAPSTPSNTRAGAASASHDPTATPTTSPAPATTPSPHADAVTEPPAGGTQ